MESVLNETSTTNASSTATHIFQTESSTISKVSQTPLGKIGEFRLDKFLQTSPQLQTSHLQICSFGMGDISPVRFYLCHKDEECCQGGCCMNKMRSLHTWYFWGIVIIIFLLYRLVHCICKRCESKIQIIRATAAQQQTRHLVDTFTLPPTTNTQFTPANQTPKVGDQGSPPLYNVAVNLPTPSSEQVPTYEQATSRK